MSETTAVRTLVKSAPELWAACSDDESLARHLGAFGEIRITRLEPETTVAWEGERASGTVTIEPSNWGTKVTMTATLAQDNRSVGEAETVGEVEAVSEEEPVGEVEAVSEAEPAAHSEPVVEVEPVAVVQPMGPKPATDGRPRGILARLAALFGRERPEAAVDAGPEPETAPEAAVVAAPEPEPEPRHHADTDPESALGAALDSLGQAHHRPFSQF